MIGVCRHLKGFGNLLAQAKAGHLCGGGSSRVGSLSGTEFWGISRAGQTVLAWLMECSDLVPACTRRLGGRRAKERITGA